MVWVSVKLARNTVGRRLARCCNMDIWNALAVHYMPIIHVASFLHAYTCIYICICLLISSMAKGKNHNCSTA